MLKLYDLKCEYREKPTGVGTLTPRFSWKAKSDKENNEQKSYRLTVSYDEESMSNGTYLFESGKVYSDKSFGIIYAGKSLKSRAEYCWRVEIEDAYGERAVSETELFRSS